MPPIPDSRLRMIELKNIQMMLLLMALALAAGTTSSAVTRRIPTVLMERVTTRPRSSEKAYLIAVTPFTCVDA